VKVDLLKGKPWKAILFFSLPILGGNMLQQLYNTVDTMVVGRVLGSDALAAVGLCAPIVFLVLGISWGLSDSSSILIGQTTGDKGSDAIKPIAYTAIIYSGVIAILVSAVCYALAEPMLRLIQTPEELMPLALEYIRVYFLGLFFFFGFNMASSTFRAMGDSTTPLIFLAVASIGNVIMDILFVAVFKWGVMGAALATVLAQAIAFLLELAVLIKRIGHQEGKIFDASYLKVLIRLAIPSTSQQILISFGNIFTQAIINTFGADVLAGYTATMRACDLAIMPMIAMGSAGTVFCSQNMGAQQYERIKVGYRSTMTMMQSFAVAAAAVLILCRAPLVGLFLGSNVNDVILAAGYSNLIYNAIMLFFWAMVFCSESFLRGAGDLNAFLFTAISGAVIKLVLALILMNTHGYMGVWFAILIGCITEAILTTLRFMSGRWKTKRVV